MEKEDNDFNYRLMDEGKEKQIEKVKIIDKIINVMKYIKDGVKEIIKVPRIEIPSEKERVKK